MLNYKYNLLSFIVLLSICSRLPAKPDVFFADSDSYNGAYLTHRFTNDFTKISFGFAAAIPGVNLRSDQYFDYIDLVNYIKNVHQFADQGIRREMVRMMKQSFYSGFLAKPFLLAFTHVLNGYIAQGGH